MKKREGGGKERYSATQSRTRRK